MSTILSHIPVMHQPAMRDVPCTGETDSHSAKAWGINGCAFLHKFKADNGNTNEGDPCTETTSKWSMGRAFGLVSETLWAKVILSGEDSCILFTKLLMIFPMVNKYLSYWKPVDVLLMLHMVMSIYKSLFASVVWRCVYHAVPLTSVVWRLLALKCISSHWVTQSWSEVKEYFQLKF